MTATLSFDHSGCASPWPLPLQPLLPMSMLKLTEVDFACAVLAAVGWPVAEKLNGPISAALGLDSLLVDGKSPTLANGGLGSVSVIYWLAALGLAVAAETSYLDDQLGVRRVSDYEPGMLKFDPLGMDGKGTRNAEVWLGRVAQLAVVGYALEEFVTKKPIALGF